MLRVLEDHVRTGFKCIFTGDETWLFHDYCQPTRWVASWEEVEEVQRPTHKQAKTMVTIFFNGRGGWTIDLLPKGTKMNSSYFVDNVLQGAIRYAAATRRPGDPAVKLHFDNAPIHNTKRAMDCLKDWKMVRIEHPPYSPDLAPCDFFLFGYLKEKLKGMTFESERELVFEIERILKKIPAPMWKSVFANWMDRLRNCVDSGGEFVE
jgi:histone-lysine N-methyltransferase SETMAR